MTEKQPGLARKLTGSQLARAFIGVLLFGVLMGLRDEFTSIWIRTLVAGCAGALFAIFLLPLRNGRQ